MENFTPRASLRWTARGDITEEVRSALAEELECRFSDESTPREGPFFGCRDVQFVAVVNPGEVTLIAHYKAMKTRFPTHPRVLQTHVELACLGAGLSVPTGPEEIRTGL